MPQPLDAAIPSEKTEISNEKKIPLKVPLPESREEAVAAFKSDLYHRGKG